MEVTPQAQSSTSISVTWTYDVGDDVPTGPVVTIYEYGPAGKLITSQADLDAVSGEALFTGLKPGTTYQYKWCATFDFGEGPNQVCVSPVSCTTLASSSPTPTKSPTSTPSKTPTPTPTPSPAAATPATPTHVSAVALAYNRAQVSWQSSGANTDSFIVMRFKVGEASAEYTWNNIAKNATTLDDTVSIPALQSNDSYFYVVEGWNATKNVAKATSNIFTVPTQLSRLTLTPATVVGGTEPVSGEVVLSAAAPASGGTVPLSTTDSVHVHVQGSVALAANAVSAQFPVSTSQVATMTQVNIDGTYGGGGASATLILMPFQLVSVSVSPTTVVGGTVVTGTVTLNAPAPSGGVDVALSVSTTALGNVPTMVTIHEGQVSAQFNVNTIPVGSLPPAPPPLKVNATYAGVTLTAELTVIPATAVPCYITNLVVTPNTIAMGETAHGTITLNQAAPSQGVKVTLSSSEVMTVQPGQASSAPQVGTVKPGPASNAAGNSTESVLVTVPPWITVPGGDETATFGIQSHSFSSGESKNVTIIAAAQEVRYALLTITA